MDVFSHSDSFERSFERRNDDDEEALRWAAIEKLPTFRRLRTSILKSVVEGGEDEEELEYEEKVVDVRKLGCKERRGFIEQVLKVAGEDNELFLRKLRNRIDKVGIELPTIEIRFEHLTVEAECQIGKRALPTLLNTARNLMESTLRVLGIKLGKRTTLTLLKNVSGIIRPSRMTLLLGPPSSGKSTLLLALAGKLDPTLKIRGEVKYNGHRLDEFVPQKTTAYISQNDVHVGEMTVKETLDFSARCQGIGSKYELLTELVLREKEAQIFSDPEVDLFIKATAVGGVESNLQTDYTLKILGLDVCADSIVGDPMRRGISGGQKKRLTTGEIIVGPTKTLFMDEISTGLDSCTTFQIVKCLQQFVHLGEGTILMSLLQPAPETFELFDDIILLSEGQIVYQGPRGCILDFFGACGFRCPKRKSIADFLQEVTSRKDQEQYWADWSKPYSYMSVSEFVKRFKKFNIGLCMKKELSIPFDKRQSHPAALIFSKHMVPTSELLKASFTKEWLLVKKNSSVYIFKTIQIIVLAIIASSVFFRTKMHAHNEEDGTVYIGALVFSMIINMFNAYPELSLTISRLPVFYKHRDLLFYPPWVFTIPNFLLRVPISMLESIAWVVMTYYSIGFAPDAIRFFKQLLVLFLIQQMAAGLFRVVAGVCRIMIISQTGGSLTFLSMFVLGGFILPKDVIPKWWIWGFWFSPLSYGYKALAVNELLAPRWMNKFTPDGRRLGVAVLENASIFPDESLYWIGAGMLLGFTILFNLLFTIALTYLNPLGKAQSIISEEPIVPTEAIHSGIAKEHMITIMESRDDHLPHRSSKVHRDNTNATWIPSKTGMILPFTPLTMTFSEVDYYVDMPMEMRVQGETEDKLQLLKGVTGSFQPQVLTALMGVSGAGKTTLMDVLSGRKTSGYIKGDIRISGYLKNQATFARVSGYCEQTDIHSPQVTVKESLMYSAFLRLPKEVGKIEKMKFVDEVIELVELSKVKDAVVGLPGVTGLSTEQRKRLTIAVELVANPSIIFMDEPTSGLDARAAAIVMRTVRKTVDTGRTVVCTIHQPSIEIFESFDELLLLKRGGQVIYSGPLGQNSNKMIDYFEAIPGVPKIKKCYNPATWMLEVSSVSAEMRFGIDFAKHYKSSDLHRHNKKLINMLSKPAPGTADLYFPMKYSQSNFGQFKACVWKQWWTYWRSPHYNLTRFFFTLTTALLLGTIFWRIGNKRNSANDLRIIIGSMYGAVLFVGINNCATVQPVITIERNVFYRERAAGMYSALPYAIAQVIVEIPYVFTQGLYYTLIVYSMMSFQWTVAKFFWFFFISFTSFLYFTYYGMMMVSITPNQHFAAIFASTFYSLFNLFSGFFIPKPKIPKWWIWYYWVCPLSWTVYGLIVTQYGDLEDSIKVPGQADQSIKVYVKNHFGYDTDFMGPIAAVLVGFSIFFAFTFAFCLRTLNFQRR